MPFLIVVEHPRTLSNPISISKSRNSSRTSHLTKVTNFFMTLKMDPLPYSPKRIGEAVLWFWQVILSPFGSMVLAPVYVPSYLTCPVSDTNKTRDFSASVRSANCSVIVSWSRSCKCLKHEAADKQYTDDLWNSGWIYLRTRYTKRKMIWIVIKAFGKLLFLFVTVKFVFVVLWLERSNVIALALGLTGGFYHLALLQAAWARWPDLTTAEALEKLHQELNS
ncbi:hypothetical protein DL98DRAFT_647813 [Cadophora sp. DSE1049]|nr:hypothetical protein DL98DRAFT_647813 [Cadophora sp. DSE1049]